MFWKKSGFDQNEIRIMANAARLLAVDMIQHAKSGHPGMPLGFADVVATLFANHLRFDPKVGDWEDRDRVILSAGHASALLYSVLHLAGYPISRDKLKTFRQLGGLSGHPERDVKQGVEMSTGPLGQGFASAVGIAIARPLNNVYVLASDGDLMEGVAMEAASFAGFRKLKNLIAIWDNNNITIDGAPATTDDIPAKFRAMGWNTIEINGLSPKEIDRALSFAKKMKAPVLIAAKTIIGYGSRIAGTSKVHGASPLEYDDAMQLMSNLTRDFEHGVALWKKLADSKHDKSHRPESIQKVKPFPMPMSSGKDASTREIFNAVITSAVQKNPDLIIGGSADLSYATGSFVDNDNFIHYGIREHAMGAVMNGLAMSGLYPFGGTFLVFGDYMRPSIRLAAMMKLPTLFVFSHDSIAVGEDGPTHQPVEQLSSLRLIPGLKVFRPCNMEEVFQCINMHFEGTGPTAIILSRQAFRNIPANADTNPIGWTVMGSKKTIVKLIATGSEVALALEVHKKLELNGIKSDVLSVPCVGLFRPKSAPFSVWIEASAGPPPYDVDMVVGIDNFGLSGDGMTVYKKFGFDAEKIATDIIKKIG